MPLSRSRFCLFLPLLAACTAPALAQENYPTRPVRVIVGFSAGGSLDLTARKASVVLASLHRELTLTQHCHALSVSFEAPQRDLAGADLACVPGAPEDCFDGWDNNCDGLIDCADPLCNPVAVCVPAGAGLDHATVAGTLACPPQYPGETLLRNGLTGTCDNSAACVSPVTSSVGPVLSAFAKAPADRRSSKSGGWLDGPVSDRSPSGSR